MTKTLTKILGVTSVFCLAAAAFALSVEARTSTVEDQWKGAYTMTAFAEGTSEGTEATATATTALSKTKYLVSTDDQYMILATLITTDDITTVYEVGYTFGETTPETSVAETNKYYTGIITKASADDTTGKRWTSKEIFETTSEQPMIVWEIKYDSGVTYTVESYCKVGEYVDGQLNPTIPETKITSTTKVKTVSTAYDAVIAATGTTTIEAETLDTSKLVFQEGHTSFVEGDTKNPENRCLKAMEAGSVLKLSFVLERETSFVISVFMSKYESDYNTGDKFTCKLNGTELTVEDVLLGRAEDGSNDWHNWKKVGLGGVQTLPAGGYTLTITASQALANIDRFEVSVIDATLSATEKVTSEAKNWDFSSVVTRQDFIDAGILQPGQVKTEAGNGQVCICGFTTGTVFTLNLYVPENMTVELKLMGADGGDLATTMSFTMDGVAVENVSGSLATSGGEGGIPAYWNWTEATVGTFELTAGVHTFVINCGQVNLVGATFTPVAAE